MTWRLPSTAEICRHHLTNKYDPTTVVFWRTHPRLFPLSPLFGFSEWKRLYIFHFRWSVWMNIKKVKSVKILFTKAYHTRWRTKNDGSNKLWFNLDKPSKVKNLKSHVTVGFSAVKTECYCLQLGFVFNSIWKQTPLPLKCINENTLFVTDVKKYPVCF